MANDGARLYGVQFHPEVTHTRSGSAILERFVRGICGCDALWDAGNIVADAIARVREQVGQDRVLLGAVRRRRLFRASRLCCIARSATSSPACSWITACCASREGDQVMETFAQHLGIRVIRVDAADRFFRRTGDEDDPERKRKIIGRLFIEVFEEEAAKLEGIRWLAQGTIYPDVIESAGSKTGKAHVIKSHHNVGGLPERMHLKLLEPLRELFKDEVRRIGLELGLPREMVFRHPFPGPVSACASSAR